MNGNRGRLLKFIGFALLATGFVVAWGIIIANQYGISEVPSILLGSINAIAIVALAFFTYSYMKATNSMAEAMKASRDLEIEIRYKPKVTLDFQAKSNAMTYLVIENSGNGAARNVAFTIDPPLKSSRKDVNDWPAINDGIGYLASHKTLTFFFDTGPEIAKYEKSRLPLSYRVKVDYDWDIPDRPRISDEFPLDLSPIMKTSLSSYKDFSDLIEEVEKIRKLLDKQR